jgi:hypothetical protein
MVPLRSHASVRSGYFQKLIDEEWFGDIEGKSLSEFRPLWREANRQAQIWSQRALNFYQPSTGRWSGGDLLGW